MINRINNLFLQTKIKGSILFLASCFILLLCSGCGIYSFRDATIDYTKLKTIKIGFIDNKARYVNPQLGSKLTDKIQSKIASSTKLSRTNSDDANLQLSGTITDYSVSTSAISSTQASSNRLTVSVDMTVRNTVENKTDNFTVTRNYDYSANLQLQQAEIALLDEIVRTLTDEIFNHLFSNW
jgi:hypothetical protein